MNRTKLFLRILFFFAAFAASNSLISQTCTPLFVANIGANGVVTLSNSSTATGTITNYYWSFPGGSPVTSTLTNPVVTYTNPGTYTITLAIFAIGPSCSFTISQVINVMPCSAALAYSAASSATTCDGVASVTAANVCGPASYTWLPGNISGNPASGLCPGVYTVLISSSGTVANCCPYISQVVNVPACALTPSFSFINGGPGNFNFINLSSGVGSNPTYTWHFGDGGTSTIANPSHTFPANGNYFTTLIVKTGLNCVDSLTIPIIVNSYTCSANFSYSVYPGGYVQFTNTSQPTSTTSLVSFNFGNGNVTSGTGIYTVANTYSSNGNYQVTLSVSVNGCVSSTILTVPVVNIPAPCLLKASFSSTNISGGLYYFQSTSTGTTVKTVYSWTASNGSTATGSSTTFNFPSPGPYTVILQATDSLCQSFKGDTITVSPINCSLTASFGHTVGTMGNVSFSSTSVGTNSNTTYKWYFGDGTGGSGNTTFHSYTNGGSHLVAHVASYGSCKDSVILSVNITGISCNANSNFTLLPTGTPHYWNAIPAYPWNVTAAKWSWGDGTTSDSLYVSHQYSVSSTYNICLSTTVSCGDTSATCSSYYVYRSSNSASAVYYVNVLPPTFKVLGVNDIAFPVIFDLFPNPNGGKFTISVESTSSQPLTIKILNVMGKLAYEKVITDAGASGILVDTGELPVGIYFVEVRQNNQKNVKKIIVNR